jgi:hypothetical protein
MLKQICAAVVLSALTGAAHAECMRALTMTFTESAPRDRFDIVHTATGVVVEGVRVDLAGSAGALIFDTESGGAGVEVFQPFQSADGLRARPLEDGADAIEVDFGNLQHGARAGFTIDVDDRLQNSDLGQIRVTGGEMEGASVVFKLANGEAMKAVFDQNNRAKVCS